MADPDTAALRAEIDDIDETLRRLDAELGPSAPGAAQDGSDAASELTGRMEVEAQVESLRRRRQELLDRLGG
jgi:hypothetical protein